MFAVALCGIEPVRWGHEATPVISLPHPDEPGFLLAASHAFAAMQDDFGSVLVLHPPGAGHERRVRTARNLADSKRVLPLPLNLSDTAVAVVADLLAQLSGQDVTAGTVLGCGPQILESVTIVARTSSVARLGVVDVALRNHAWSLVPGTTFSVVASPERRVVRGRLPLPPVAGSQRLVTAGDAAFGAPLLAELRSSGDVGETTPGGVVHRDERASLSWWQARRVFEAIRVPVDLSALVEALRSRPSPRCPSCGDTAVESECQFCSLMEVL